MITLDEAYVDAAAPNVEAAKNGRALAIKKQFVSLNIAADQSVLFGQCQGSGKTPYRCSSDFIRPGAPTHRCSCPSRQFPCKHCIGLMHAYVREPSSFTVAEVPEEILGKREKIVAQVEKAQESQAKPKNVNKSALAKKIKAQLEGIGVLEQLTWELAQIGIGNMNAKLTDTIEARAKQLADAYLPGAQAALLGYTSLFKNAAGKFDDKMSSATREALFSAAFDQLGRLHSLIKLGRNYLEKRLADPELQPETGSSIASWLGHAWQLDELREAGLTQERAELLQLAFNSHDDIARQEMVDTGLWLELETGKVLSTKTYRPYKALKHIKAEDSFFQIAQVPLLCIYPGELNTRCRWEEMLPRALETADLARARAHALADFQSAVKMVKNNLKGPLSEKQPVCLLRFKRLGRVNDQFVIEDAQGNRLVLTDQGMPEEPQSLSLLRFLPPEASVEQILVGRFHHDLDRSRLEVKPLSLITQSEVIRLTL